MSVLSDPNLTLRVYRHLLDTRPKVASIPAEQAQETSHEVEGRGDDLILEELRMPALPVFRDAV